MEEKLMTLIRGCWVELVHPFLKVRTNCHLLRDFPQREGVFNLFFRFKRGRAQNLSKKHTGLLNVNSIQSDLIN